MIIKIFSKIETEIFTKEKTFRKFIYYIQNTQIYFDYNKEQIKRKSNPKEDNVIKIKITVKE